MTERTRKGPRVQTPETHRAPRAPNDRESRGPETSHFPEDDTFSVDRSQKRPPGREFDDDLIR
jgi:hypothetical protein